MKWRFLYFLTAESRMLEKLSDSYTPEEEFKIYKINDHPHAKCLDGSSPVYYHRLGSGSGSKKFIFYMESGGWCFYPEASYSLEGEISHFDRLKLFQKSPFLIFHPF